MLKHRIIPTLLLLEGRLVKGKVYGQFKETGLAKTAIRVYSSQDSDELVLLNIDKGKGSFSRLLEILKDASGECFMPLTAGGGVENEDHAKLLFGAGADKILVTTQFAREISFLDRLISMYGSQSIVAGLEYREEGGKAVVTYNNGRDVLGKDLVEYAKELEDHGAGEIFMSCITRDGIMQGYDIANLKRVANSVSIPVVVCGGAGNYSHLEEAFKQGNASGVACASIFHFGDNTPIRARSFMRNAQVPMRRLK